MRPTLKTLTRTDLAKQRDSWNSLWRRSAARQPIRRAEGVELWCDTFARDSDFTALVVEQNGQFQAALPMVTQRRWGQTVYRLPSNGTIDAGDLLLDESSDRATASRLLAEGLVRLPGSLAAFDPVEVESTRWTALLDALRVRGCAIHLSEGFPVGVVDIVHDWDRYQRSWSRNHRSMIKRSRKKLEAAGNVSVENLRTPGDSELHDVLEECYAIEDWSWKGDHGTSILRSPGLREYYHQEARLMRDLGMLDLWLLKVNHQTIAFEYCHLAKGTCLSHKISFDPEWQKYSPGRVLRSFQLQHYHGESSVERLDTLGVLCEAKAKWVTSTYASSRCFVAIGGGLSSFALNGFRHARSIVKRLRGVQTQPTWPEPGAARCLRGTESDHTSPIPTIPASSGPTPIEPTSIEPTSAEALPIGTEIDA